MYTWQEAHQLSEEEETEKKKNWDKAKTEYYGKQLRERKENGGGQEVLEFTG